MDDFTKYTEGLPDELRVERLLPFFIGYACGAARSKENIEQIIEAFKAATEAAP